MQGVRQSAFYHKEKGLLLMRCIPIPLLNLLIGCEALVGYHFTCRHGYQHLREKESASAARARRALVGWMHFNQATSNSGEISSRAAFGSDSTWSLAGSATAGASWFVGLQTD
jgi:hypothetical protein